ncbi:MAG: hypothetical protein WCO06_04280 [Candidatus Roizmanbacteria bacterium]
MVAVLLIILVLLWVTGYINIPNILKDTTLFSLSGKSITLFDLIIFGLVLWLITLLPRPFQQIAGVILIVWLLTVLGLLQIAGLDNILIIALIVGVIVYLFK